MVVGCACGSVDGGLDQPDNPTESSGMCCNRATKQTVMGTQDKSWAWCVKYSPPPRPPTLMPPPPSPPPADVCSKDSMVAGCKCASQGFGHGLPDNPSSTSDLCCDQKTKKTATGVQVTSYVTCVNYSPPPRPPPPMPPPLSPPPNDVCSTSNMVAGCKCGSRGFGHGLPDNPLVSTGLCCDQATKKTVTGAQITSRVTCVVYSPPPRPPPPMPPPPSPPPADECSKGNFFAGCTKCGDTVGVDCPPKNTRLCCHKATKVAVKGSRAMSSRWCASSVKAPSRRHLLTGDYEIDEKSLSPPPPPASGIPDAPAPVQCCNANGDDWESITAGECCDQDTLARVPGGKQCATSAWCNIKARPAPSSSLIGQ